MSVGLIAGPAGSAFASDAFSDVPDDHAFHDEIGWMAGEEITTGFAVDGAEQDEFRPKLTVTRQAIAAFFYRYANPTTSDCVEDETTFDDVPFDHDFCEEIEWMAGLGITNGWDDGNGNLTFRPTENVSREAVAAFFYRHAEASATPCDGDGAESGFEDVPVGHAFCNEINWLATQEPPITTGWEKGDGTFDFRPKAEVSREAAAAFFYRYAGEPTGTQT